MDSAGTSFSIVSLIIHASFGVQIIMLVLLVFSIISWKLILEQSSKLRKAENKFSHFEMLFYGTEKNKAIPINHIYEEAKKTKFKDTFDIFFVIVKSLKFYENNSCVFRPSVKNSNVQYENDLLDVFEDSFFGQVEETEQLFKNKISLLGTISSTSPYIGLLGTVYGILIAFWGLGTSQQATVATVAPHIAEALIATAMGLFVAIPSLIAYNRLNHRVDVLLDGYLKVEKNLKIKFKRIYLSNLNKK